MVMLHSAVLAQKKKNVVVVLTDDQDLTLGGWTPLPRTRALIDAHGMMLENHFVNTPVCCPSRATLLSGRHLRSIRERGGCMHVDIVTVNDNSFAAVLGEIGYSNAYFGKHLNECVDKPPAGYACSSCRWFAYDGGPDTDPGSYAGNVSFHDYSGGAPHAKDEVHPEAGRYVSTDAEYAGYTTAILGNLSVAWVAQAPQPFTMVVGHRAPHVPATPAPWYRTEFADLAAPRDPAYNASDLGDFHWLIAQQDVITAQQSDEIDELFRDRWRALLSVDDANVALVAALDLEETFVFFTSDNGYNLGQHRLPSCKLNVYDHDLRVPAAVLGLRRGGVLSLATSHVDIKPTILALAANLSCDDCQGRDLADRFDEEAPVYVEYYSLGNVTRTGHLVDDTSSNTYSALRFAPPHAYGHFLYAEFSSLLDWNFEAVSFREAFDLATDPHQLTNVYAHLSDDTRMALAVQLNATRTRVASWPPAARDPLGATASSPHPSRFHLGLWLLLLPVVCFWLFRGTMLPPTTSAANRLLGKTDELQRKGPSS